MAIRQETAAPFTETDINTPITLRIIQNISLEDFVDALGISVDAKGRKLMEQENSRPQETEDWVEVKLGVGRVDRSRPSDIGFGMSLDTGERGGNIRSGFCLLTSHKELLLGIRELLLPGASNREDMACLQNEGGSNWRLTTRSMNDIPHHSVSKHYAFLTIHQPSAK